MAKNIILLADGTGNSAGKLFKTNVWRLYDKVDLAHQTTPAKCDQIAYYSDGVGTSAFKPLAILGGAFGWGLKRNVIDLYTFLCRNYEPDDRIYVFGFSRGAFTVRVLVGLIYQRGLITYRGGDDEFRAEAGREFSLYRDRYRSGLRKAASRYAQRAVSALGKTRPEPKKRAQPKGAAIPIAFVGVWDTVAAYGLPFDELTRAWDFVYPLSLPDRTLCDSVQRACQALALTEERQTFRPVLWDESTMASPASNISQERLTQVWFPGVHSNVGGGYPDDAVANVSLHWMMVQAERAGLHFNDDALKDVQADSDKYGKLYDSRRGVGSAYRYKPRSVAYLSHDVWGPHDKVIVSLPKVHHSALDRIAEGTDGFAPISLPAAYAEVDPVGNIQPLAPAHAPGRETTASAAARASQQESCWDLVWLRRGTYFAGLFLGIALALFPWLLEAQDSCAGRLCILAPAIRGIGAVLPSWSALWLDAYASHPDLFAVLILLLVGIMLLGQKLRVEIHDVMYPLWGKALTLQRPAPPPVVVSRRGEVVAASALVLLWGIFATSAATWENFLSTLISRSPWGAASLSERTCFILILGFALFLWFVKSELRAVLTGRTPLARHIRNSTIYRAVWRELSYVILPAVIAFVVIGAAGYWAVKGLQYVGML